MAVPLRRSDPIAIAAAFRTFFVTSSITGQRNLLQSHRSAKLFIEVLYHYRDEHKYLLHDFVRHDGSFPRPNYRRRRDDHRARSPVHQRRLCVSGRERTRIKSTPVWQRGFSEVRIYDSQSLVRVKECIAQNPAKRGLAKTPPEYLYSSAHCGFDLDEVPQGLKPAVSLRLVGTPEGAP